MQKYFYILKNIWYTKCSSIFCKEWFLVKKYVKKKDFLSKFPYKIPSLRRSNLKICRVLRKWYLLGGEEINVKTKLTWHIKIINKRTKWISVLACDCERNMKYNARWTNKLKKFRTYTFNHIIRQSKNFIISTKFDSSQLEGAILTLESDREI